MKNELNFISSSQELFQLAMVFSYSASKDNLPAKNIDNDNDKWELKSSHPFEARAFLLREVVIETRDDIGPGQIL